MGELYQSILNRLLVKPHLIIILCLGGGFATKGVLELIMYGTLCPTCVAGSCSALGAAKVIR